MKIIGITGTLGAGKGAVAAYLRGKGFKHYSARDFIVREVERRGFNVDRNTMRQTANDLRAEHGPGYIAKALCEAAESAGIDAVIESIRTIAGVQVIKAKAGKVLAIDADPRIRYERIKARGSATDQVSYERFLEEEFKEMANPEPHLGNLAACIALADHKIMNNGTLEELYAQVDQFLSQ